MTPRSLATDTGFGQTGGSSGKLRVNCGMCTTRRLVFSRLINSELVQYHFEISVGS